MVVAVALVAGGYRIGVWRMEESNRLSLVAQEKSLIAKCDADEHTTQESNDALQKQFSIISDKLDAAKRMRSSCCTVSTAGSAEPAGSGGEHAGQNGISVGWLYEYAAECEIYRQERIVLERFIAAERVK